MIPHATTLSAPLRRTPPKRRTCPTVQLVERLTEQVSTLVRTEIAAGLDEVKNKGTRLGIGIGISGAGAVLALFGLATLIAAAVLGLAARRCPLARSADRRRYCSD